MKVEQKIPTPVFPPITITLESEREADYFWAALNCSRDSVEENNPGIPKDTLMKNFASWSDLDDVYAPKWSRNFKH